MKIFQRTITKLTCLSTLAGFATLGQVAEPPALPVLPSPAAPEDVFLNRVAAPVAGLQLAQTLGSAHEAIALAPDAPYVPGAAAAWFQDGNVRFDFLGGSPRPRTLVIRSAETDPKSLSTLEEDLNVMSRILSKALKGKSAEDEAVTAMGMTLKTLTLSSQSPVQNLYLDGYGALFLLHVRFPLLPPPEPSKESETPKEPKDSTWEEARRELYGPKEPAAGAGRQFFSKEKTRETFDAKKVAKLKDSLIESLKNASNIQNLKPQEFITVVAIGGESAPFMHVINRVVSNTDPNHASATREYQRARIGTDGAAPRLSSAETMMTIRVKKADVDAFAKGDLKFEDFQKKVSVVTY